ncbi:MAG: ester cyclase [Ktedonobacterales bacterium]|jgi:predicted ester cyclase
MTRSETVRALLTAIEQQRWDEAKSYLTDDYTFGGAVPQPISADAWLGVHKAFAAGMPDFSFNASDIREEQGIVLLRMQLSGTQTRELALPIPGVPAIAPTGKRVQLPQESCSCAFRGDKVASYTVETTPGGGVPGILAQLGAALPAHG